MLLYPLEHTSVAEAFPGWDVRREPLGEGTFKSAYLAERGGDPIVLKIVREPHIGASDAGEGDLTLPERFAREIEAMRDLDTPRVVRILDGPSVRSVGDADRLWYVEPFYRGGSLTDRLGDPWPERNVIQLMRDMVEGVRALASEGLVHRDIKPDNVAFDETSRAVLLDLGIALHENRTPLTDGGQAGPHTPMYAAPEQLMPRRSAVIDFRTDLFLIGMTAFEALTGSHPFKPSMPRMAERLLSGDFDADALDAAAPSSQLKDVVQRLLGANPNQRYRKPEYALRAIEDCV